MANQSKFIRNASIVSACTLASLLYFVRHRAVLRKKLKKELAKSDALLNIAQTNDSKKQSSKRPAVNKAFFKQLRHLLTILVPSWMSAEAGYTALVAVLLVLRTLCDVWMINNGTSIEAAIISRNKKSFIHYVGRFGALMLPISVINQLLKYGLQEMKLRFRERLTSYLFDKYMTKNFTYYQISNLDNRINNVDQLLTQDVEKFCESVTELYSNVSKPLLDICIYAASLTSAIGGQGPLTMLAYLVGAGVFLTGMRRPLSRFTVQEQVLEGEWRYVNSRLLTNAEEVAFYDGHAKEKEVIDTVFKRVVLHLRRCMEFRFTVGIVDNIVAKYFATVVGYYCVSRPFLNLDDPRHKNSSHSEIMEDYYRSGRQLVNLAGAVGRLVLAGRELTRLAGFTSRVVELDTVLDDLNNGKYERSAVTAAPDETLPDGSVKRRFDINKRRGKLVEIDEDSDILLSFEDVPIVTPNGDLLTDHVSFEIKPGMNTMVVGPNGCGKSSAFRILSGLWPVFDGVVRRPPGHFLVFIPQRPYMTLGTLRDQIVYPHKQEDLPKGMTDKDLRELLDFVKLEYLADRDGFDSVQDWADVLSGGEKQRLAMARLLYHKPKIAILDECTSAVSVDVEASMYKKCKELGMALFTISHRKSLWAHHDYLLEFDGRGAYSFGPIGDREAIGT